MVMGGGIWASSDRVAVYSVSDLRKITGGDNLKSINVLGYYTLGDAGGGPARTWATGTPGTYVDNGGSIIVPTGGDGSGAWVGPITHPWTVREFGAKGDSVTDDTASIQAAHTASANVLYPAGTYLVSSAIAITQNNTNMRGDGNATKVVTNNVTSDIYTLGDNAAEIVGFTCRNMSVDSTVQKSAGWAFNCRMIARAVFENVYITRPEDTVLLPRIWGGIYFDRLDYCSVLGGNITASNRGIACRGNANQSFGAGLFLGDGLKITNNCILGSTNTDSIGVLIGGGVSGVHFGNMDIIACGNSVIIDVSLQASTPNRKVFFGAECSLDSPGFANIFVQPDSLTYLDITGTGIASSGVISPDGGGLITTTPNANLVIKLTGPRFFNNAGGAVVASAGDFSWSGGTVYSNGTGGTGYDAILVNTGVPAFRMTGVKVDNNGTSVVGYGIKFVSGAASTVLNVQGNSFFANAQGSVLYGDAFSQDRIIRNNAQFITESNGVSTITAGTSSVVVTHGITTTRACRVIVTPVGDFPESGQYWVSSPTSTQFTLNLGTTASRNNDFYWAAYAI